MSARFQKEIDSRNRTERDHFRSGIKIWLSSEISLPELIQYTSVLRFSYCLVAEDSGFSLTYSKWLN